MSRRHTSVEDGSWSEGLLTEPAMSAQQVLTHEAEEDHRDVTELGVRAPSRTDAWTPPTPNRRWGDEVDADVIHEGALVRVLIDSHPRRVFEGAVSRVAPYVVDVEEQNRTFEIEVELASAGTNILPGVSADVEVILDTRKDCVRVPASALRSDVRVFVLEGERAVARSIDIGIRNWDYAEIVSCLTSGESILLPSADSVLEHNSLVEVGEVVE